MPVFKMAPGHGFEPRLDDPESPVLPLDDPGIFLVQIYSTTSLNNSNKNFILFLTFQKIHAYLYLDLRFVLLDLYYHVLITIIFVLLCS